MTFDNVCIMYISCFTMGILSAGIYVLAGMVLSFVHSRELTSSVNVLIILFINILNCMVM